MKNKPIFTIVAGLIIACCYFMGAAYADTPYPIIHPPKGNATWVYDSNPNTPDQKKDVDIVPGMWVQNLTDYNNGASDSSKLSTIFSYGGDVEMYYNKTTEKWDIFVYYDQDGHNSTAQYSKVPGVNVMPIVDGRLDGPYLKPFNSKSEYGITAADEISAEYCADPNVSGVQVDLEPFDISQPGQKALFSQLAKNFTSKTCVGRYFSFFAFSGNVKSEAEWQTIADDLNPVVDGKRKAVGFFVDSGYDLGTKVGVAESPAEYRIALTNELKTIKGKADQYGFFYMVGIPAAASTMEFESTEHYSGPRLISGYQQVDYMKNAIAVINELKLRDDPYFLGVSLWGWSKFMTYPPHSLYLDWPNQPTPDVITYLKGHL